MSETEWHTMSGHSTKAGADEAARQLRPRYNRQGKRIRVVAEEGGDGYAVEWAWKDLPRNWWGGPSRVP